MLQKMAQKEGEGGFIEPVKCRVLAWGGGCCSSCQHAVLGTRSCPGICSKRRRKHKRKLGPLNLFSALCWHEWRLLFTKQGL